MAEFLTTSGCQYHIEKIIREAQTSLTIVSPYIRLKSSLLERLRDANDRGVAIDVIFGKEELLRDARVFFEATPSVAVYYHPHLHAKYYFNESDLVVSSMNLYQASSRDENREVGIHFSAAEDGTIYHSAATEALSIVNASEQIKQREGSRLGQVHQPYGPVDCISNSSDGVPAYMQTLANSVRAFFPAVHVEWTEATFSFALGEGSVHVTYRLEVNFPEGYAQLEDEMLATIDRSPADVRVFSNRVGRFTVYPPQRIQNYVPADREKVIVEQFGAALKAIVETFTRSKNLDSVLPLGRVR